MRVVIAGGGTGGHIYPAIAVADELAKRSPGAEIHFVGTERGLEARAVPRAGYTLHFVPVAGVKNTGAAGLARAGWQVPLAVAKSLALLRKLRPQLVLGAGGYASGPTLLAAWLARIPTAVLEQNALPGITNRISSHFVGTVFATFPESKRHFPHTEVIVTGNPIRPSVLAARDAKPHTGLNVLVFGGSQGARALNQCVEGVARLLAKTPLAGLRIRHQTGKLDHTRVQALYTELGSKNLECVEFIDDMGSAYAEADLVVCRAGATTLAELTACGKPAILVPLPTAADNHQEHNARALADAGAARMLLQPELTPESLLAAFSEYAAGRAKLAAMAQASRALARPDAAARVVDGLLRIAGVTQPEPFAATGANP